jgi:UDP-2-acetamido-2-deoxy-ribo-hexuluronate aminotransferase
MTMQFTNLKAQYATLKASIDARIQRVLDHGQYIMGPEVAEMEAALARYAGARHCVAVASGTEALLISLMALELRPGDEVVTTPFTFAATAETIALLGAKPVFVDIEADTCNIDAAQVEAAITPRTKVLMPVSLYGQVADMDTLDAIAARHGLAVVEDAAQSFGASYRGRRSCALSTIGCTSFFPSKPLGCYGDGGALFTNDDTIARAAREIRVHGQSGRYHHTRIGVGGRMDTLQCAVGWEIERRNALGDRDTRLLRESGAPVRLLAVRRDRDCVWAQYTVLVDDRDRVRAALDAAGIPTAVHYPRPLHHQPAFAAGHDPNAHPNSIRAAQCVVSLPMSADLTEAEQDRVVIALAQALAEQAQPSTA